MSAFQWLNTIIEKVLRFLPRLEIVRSTYGGVAFVRGKPREIRGGRLCLYWPLWTEIETYPIVRQTVNLPAQVLTTADSPPKALVISGVVIYDIGNVEAALTKVHDLEDSLTDFALIAIREAVVGHTLAQLLAKGGGLDDDVRKALVARVKYLGVRVIGVCITDLAPCMVIQSIGCDAERYVPINGGDE